MKYSVVTCTKIKVLARLTNTAAMKAKRSDREVKKVEDVECHQKLLSSIKIMGDLGSSWRRGPKCAYRITCLVAYKLL